MIKIYTLILTAVFLLPTTTYAGIGLCQSDQLQIDFIDENSYAEVKTRGALIHGEIDMPTPGYIYTLMFEPLVRDGTLRGFLQLREQRPGTPKPSVITPLKIEQTFEIPHDTATILIEVDKNFNWGSDYYKTDIHGVQSICMSPLQK